MYDIKLLDPVEDIKHLVRVDSDDVALNADYDVVSNIVRNNSLDGALSELLKLEPASKIAYPIYSQYLVVSSPKELRTYAVQLIHINSKTRLVVCLEEHTHTVRAIGNINTLTKFLRGLNIVADVNPFGGEVESMRTEDEDTTSISGVLKTAAQKAQNRYVELLVENYIATKVALCKNIAEELHDDTRKYAHGYLNTQEDIYYVLVDDVEHRMDVQPMVVIDDKTIQLRITIIKDRSLVEEISLYLSADLSQLWSHMNQLLSKIQAQHIPGDQLAICC